MRALWMFVAVRGLVRPVVPVRHAWKPRATDVDGLRREASRRLDRSRKKIGKKTSRLVQLDGAERDECLAALETLRQDERRLAELASLLESDVEKGLALAAELQVPDAPPPRVPRTPKVKKAPPVPAGQRLPYWKFASEAGTEIRVGRSAPDNDLLSLQHRDGSDWWLHAQGSAGSHVVVRDADPDRDTVTDAACLAALYSKAVPKAPEGSLPKAKAKVSLVQARQVSKPQNAKAGLVRLSGDVRTISLDLGLEHVRLNRLLATKQL